MLDKSQEIMQKVRRIELMARKRATAAFAGQYRSSFRGQGLDFDDFREYSAGDEPRFIDWKVTARTGTPYVRKFYEEREQVLLLAVDTSASMCYASERVAYTKLEYAAHIAAVLSYSAALNGDKVGLLLFGRGNSHFYLPPAQGMKQTQRIVREIICSSTDGQDMTMDEIATEILRTQRKSAMVFMMSDFLAEPDKKALGRLGFRHELIPVRVADPCELQLPASGMINFRDPESGEQWKANLNDAQLRQDYAEAMRVQRLQWELCFTQLGIDFVDLVTSQDYILPLRKMFQRRSRFFAH